jgi:hypothetical protein
MRRISLAFALAGAVAATGCGGNVSPNGSGDGKGVGDGTFTVTVQNAAPLAITGGVVISVPAGINCGSGATACSFDFANDVTVTLTATANATPGNSFLGFAGDCIGSTCALTGNSDRYLVAMFGPPGSVPHEPWGDPAKHAPLYLAYVEGAPGAVNCTSCHGANLGGQGLAPSCASCHGWPMGKHFEASGHNSGTCARCHSGGGFRDFIGADNTISNVASLGYGSSAVAPGDKAVLTTPVCDPAAVPPVKSDCYDANKLLGTNAVWYYASGMQCDMCHNTGTVLGGGTLNQHKFPSGNTVTMDGKSAICSQCHDGGRPGYEVSQVKAQLTAAAATDMDAVLTGSSNNKLVRAHYVPGASTLFGEEAGNWYEYAASCSKTAADGSPITTSAACVAAVPTPGVWTNPGTVTAAASRNNYTARNEHGGVSSCTFCHNAHTGELPADPQIAAKCGGCHNDELTGLPVRKWVELEESRQFGFEGDIDGDAAQESLKLEIDGLRAKLLATVRNYATNVAGADICFDGDNRFYLDDGANGGVAGDGICAPASCSLGSAYHDKTSCEGAAGTWSAGESNAYNKFTARLLPATYNYLIATNDAGAWAHNPRYAIEVIYDAIADLNAGLVAKGKAASPNGIRAFNSHFGAAEDPSPLAAMIYHGAANATTHESLPAMGFTSGACYQCHGGKGGVSAYLAAAPVALASAVITDANKVTALQCDTCHAFDGVDMKGIRSDIAKVYFPPQKDPAATLPPALVIYDAVNLPSSFALCASCHSGRENGQSITNRGGTDGTFALSFTNPHYLGAAGMMLGDNAKVMYQYAGKTYTKNPAFWAAGTKGDAPGPHGSPHGAQCTGCHDPKNSKHTFEVDFTYCNGCHTGQYALAPIEEEYAAGNAELLTAIRAYATANLPAIQTAVGGAFAAGGATPMTNVCYNPNANPYWFVETASGCTTTSFGKFDPKLLKAAFNYQWTQKEPGAWAHNEFYVMQVVFDSIVDLGGTPTFTVGGAYTPAAEKRP